MNLAFRFLYFGYGLFAVLRHRIPRRVTPAGLTVLAGFGVVSLIGLDTENTVAYQGSALLLFLLMVSWPYIFFFKARFSAARLLPKYGTAGIPFSYHVVLTNLTPKTQRSLMLLENLLQPWPPYREWLAAQRADRKWTTSLRLVRRRRADPFRTLAIADTVLPSIPSKQEVDARIEFVPRRRGVLRFTGLTLARPDPLGLFRAFARVSLPQTVLILPKRYPLPPIALPGTTRYQQGGVTFASDVGQSEEFVALREYRRGDPLRHIHWRSWAKAGKPIVKEFEDEFFVRHALVLDTFTGDPQSEVFEEAVSVAASFACTILTQESLLDLLFVGPQAYCFTAGRGLARTDQILEILAAVRPCGDKPFGALASLVLDHTAVVSGCFCVLLAWDEPRQALVRKLKALRVPVLVVVVTDPAQNRSLDPGPLRDEPDRFHVLETGAIEQGLAKLR